MTLTFTKPLTETVAEAETLLVQLTATAARLVDAIEDERTLYFRLQDAQAGLETAENELIVAADVEAQNGGGMLAGIARTSATYKATLAYLLAEAPGLQPQRDQMRRLRLEHEAASISREQQQVLFKSLCVSADLKSSIIKASM